MRPYSIINKQTSTYSSLPIHYKILAVPTPDFLLKLYQIPGIAKFVSDHGVDRVSTYILQLARDFGSPVLPKMAPVVIKMLNVCFGTLPYYRDTVGIGHDDKFPFVRDVLNTDVVISFTARVMKKIASGQGPFSNSKDILLRYNMEVAALKSELLLAHQFEALSWKSRHEFLFLFCRELIEDTMHPLIRYMVVSETENSPKVRKDVPRLLDCCSKFVLGIVIPDDIADNIQVKEILQYFVDAKDLTVDDWLGKPDDAALTALRKEVKQNQPKYLGLFDLYCDLWKDCVRDLAEVIGLPVLKAKWGEIQAAWILVMKCLQESVDINTSPYTPSTYGASSTSHQTEALLANNMLMTFFKAIEGVYLNSLTFTSPYMFRHALVRTFQVLCQSAEYIGHSANHIATAKKELYEHDYTNNTFMVIGDALTAYLDDKSLDFVDYAKSLNLDLAKKAAVTDIDTFNSILFSLKDLDKAINNSICTLLALGSSLHGQFEVGFKDCKDVTETVRLARVIFRGRDGCKDVLDELDKLTEKREARIQLILQAIEDPVHEGFKTYLSGLQDKAGDMRVQVTKITSARPEFADVFEDYLNGVRKLFVLYLLFKSEGV